MLLGSESVRTHRGTRLGGAETGCLAVRALLDPLRHRRLFHRSLLLHQLLPVKSLCGGYLISLM